MATFFFFFFFFTIENLLEIAASWAFKAYQMTLNVEKS